MQPSYCTTFPHAGSPCACCAAASAAGRAAGACAAIPPLLLSIKRDIQRAVVPESIMIKLPAMPQQPHAGGKNPVLPQRAQRAFRKCWCFYVTAKMAIWLPQFCACLVETREKGSGTLRSATVASAFLRRQMLRPPTAFLSSSVRLFRGIVRCF